MPENYESENNRSEILKGGEYNFDSVPADSPDNSEATFSYSSENSSGKEKKNRKTLKASVCVLLLAAIGYGSVQGYKWLNETKKELAEYAGESSVTKNSDQSLNNSSNETDELPSLIELASRSDAKYLPDIVDEIMPSVVGVSSTFEYIQPSFSIWGWEADPQIKQGKATGTGFIITDDGYIVTNAHVIYDESEYDAREAIDVSVLLSDETEHTANVIAYDLETDIAVLKINQKGLKPAALGDSDELRVGELVLAVGNPLGFDFFGSVTSGIVSALNRQISINEKSMTLIQTDAAINSGNSGGPLLNSCGQVIGINSAKMSASYGSASIEGLGFAIPMKEAKTIIDDLINYNYVKGRPLIGISTVDINESYSRYLNKPMGLYVCSVEENSAADQAGIMAGDVIIGIEGEPIKTVDELNKIKNQHKAGETIKITLSRNGTDIDVNVKLQEENNSPEKNSENEIKKELEISDN